MKDIIRWILIAPAVLVGFYAALILGMLGYLIAEGFCPEEAMDSGMCTAPYMRVFEKIAFVVFPTMASLFIIWTVYFLAPKYKLFACLSSYIIGCAVAIYLGWSTQLWFTIGSVIVFAGLSLLIQYRIIRERHTKFR